MFLLASCPHPPSQSYPRVPKTAGGSLYFLSALWGHSSIVPHNLLGSEISASSISSFISSALSAFQLWCDLIFEICIRKWIVQLWYWTYAKMFKDVILSTLQSFVEYITSTFLILDTMWKNLLTQNAYILPVRSGISKYVNDISWNLGICFSLMSSAVEAPVQGLLSESRQGYQDY